MATDRPPIVYWDTCVFLALIQNEVRPESSGIQAVREEVRKGNRILITSVITRAEILVHKTPPKALRELDLLFRSSNIKALNVDYPVGEKAADLLSHYLELNKIDGRGKVSFPDALHLATAMVYAAEEFQTFDEKGHRGERGLLGLDGDPALGGLRVCRPRTGQGLLDLEAGRR